MELLSLLLVMILPLLLLIVVTNSLKKPNQARRNLPPGTTGLPFIGESLDFIRANQSGEQNKFMVERVQKYGSQIFKTSLYGENMVVMCGPEANKFLFSNEGKKVELWWPESMQRLIRPCLLTKFGEAGRADKKMMMNFFSMETLKRWVATMDLVTRLHLSSQWEGKKEVKVYPAMKSYTFEVACRLLMSITEPELLSRLAFHFNIFVKGIISMPLNFPGTRFYKAMRAAETIREELRVLLRQRRVELEKMGADHAMKDMMSYMLTKATGNGRLMPEGEISNNLLLLLFAGHDTSSCVLTLMIKYLAEFPQVHQKVLAEQMEIAATNTNGELLKWEDLQRMKYTWNVVCEVMRMIPPVPGTYRQAIVDFTFDGYTISKGCKILWSASFTHKDASSYERPTKFDESRFEGSGPPPFSYVPFGGGPRMCLGKEFARLEILIFLHNLVNRFDWDLSIPNERVAIDPFPTPVSGLPVRLRPREVSS